MKKLFLSIILTSLSATAFSADRPNILWISSEDNGPHLGCYGDSYAVTPHLDKFAGRSLRYTRASSNAPVCAPARTTIISGIYPPSTGSENMRSEVNLPAQFKMFPQYLRAKGYYCTNSSKEDYNLKKPGQVWDQSNKKAHWKDRADGQPFFAVFNYTISHESKIRNEIDDKDRIHDPAGVRIPAYHPDTPEVRKDWAQYNDRITMMDKQCGDALQEIEEAGLAEDTIIFYWGDHGSGMPRSKRWPYNSGLHVPLMAHFPEKWKHLAPDEYKPGGTSDRMVGFVDFAPTTLSIAGIKPKKWMQGHAFAGEFEKASPEFSYGFRGRMDERVDLVRTVMGKRYIYLRQYMPHRIYGQHINYMFVTPTTQQWHDMFHAGELNEAQSHFWRRKPTEELYDIESDPDEVNNLAGSAAHQEILKKMRKSHREWEREIKDVCFLPEAEVHSRSVGSSPYETGHDSAKYDFDSVFAAAQLASSQKKSDIPAIIKLLASDDSAVRYWGATGLLIHEKAGVAAGHDVLVKALNDSSGSVAVVAAETLGRFGSANDQSKAIEALLSHANQESGNVFEAILAVNSIDYLDASIKKSKLKEIKSLPDKPKGNPPRVGGYVGRLLEEIAAGLER